MREYWTKNNFIEIHTPKLVGAPSESGAELFSLDYFERKAYLAQSPQFYKQMAMASGFERIFEIGPVFRADPSFTSRHMTEFTGVDMEMSWIDSHEDVMASEEQWLNYVYTRVKEQYGDAIKEQFGIDLVVPTLPFPRIPMKEAVEILKGRGWVPADKKGDIDPAGEREIAAYVKEKYNHDFVFLTDWPIGVRPVLRSPLVPSVNTALKFCKNRRPKRVFTLSRFSSTSISSATAARRMGASVSDWHV